jgi:predicted transcriptional regulator
VTSFDSEFAIIVDMDAAGALKRARRRAALTQRALAARTGVAQPTVARIETGTEVPRVDTLAVLLRACGEELEPVPLRGLGVDRTQIRALLQMTPRQRLQAAARDAAGLHRLERAAQR